MKMEDFSLKMKTINGVYILKVYYRGHCIQALGTNRRSLGDGTNFLSSIKSSYTEYVNGLMNGKYPDAIRMIEKIDASMKIQE